ncbi:universal stress protein [Methanobrevibacter oralis]|uniref:TRAP-T-associated universal stress protein TeaD n=2 Tax=Methanobrevibacter oralis TaxID=66851 RepID=A0A166AAK6_METOA|nr:universal stress protein [Methanobrevibacter oralis]KZX11789.1 TRAP-T-associated universal stress protein TeaD [Methanobrevibacter oralis]
MYKKILLPTDGSTFASEEVERATKLLSDDGEVIILSVASKLTATTFQSKKEIEKVNRAMYEEAEGYVNSMAELFDEDMPVTKKVIVGFPAEVICEFAEEEDIDLIIISASGKSGFHKLIIGSVAEKVLKTTQKDVLLVHGN